MRQRELKTVPPECFPVKRSCYWDGTGESALFVWQERIQEGNAKGREIAFVASGHGEAVNARGGGDHRILNQGIRLAVHETRPFAKAERIHRQNLDGGRELIYPGLDFLGFLFILRPRSFNAGLQLTQGDGG